MDIMDSVANTKVKVIVKRNGKNVAELVKLGDIFSIDEAAISEEMTRQAGLYAYFAVQMAHAEYSHARASVSKDKEYAAADEAYRNDLAKDFAQSGKKLTEAVVKAAIIQDEDYQDTLSAENTAKLNYRLLRTICQALEMRATMLQSVGAHLRHELDMTGMNTRDRRYQSAIGDVRKAVTNSKQRQV